MSRIQRTLAAVAETVYTAGEGLELVGKQFKIKAGSITNAMVKAAAGIEESKLSLPEVIKKRSGANIESKKEWNPLLGGSSPTAVAFYNSPAETAVSLIEILTFVESSSITFTKAARLCAIGAGGEAVYQVEPSEEACMQLFRNLMKIVGSGEHNMTPIVSFLARPELEPGAKTKTKGWTTIGFDASVRLGGVAEAGTAEGEMTGFRARLEGGFSERWTVPVYRGLRVEDPIEAIASLPISVGVEIDDLKKATTNYSLRSKGTAVKLLNEGPAELGGTLKVKGATTLEGATTLPAETVTKAELVKAVQEELLKIAAPTAIGAYTSGQEETETKGTFVTLVVTIKAEAAAATVKLVNSAQEISFKWDGVALGAQRVPLQFMVKKAGKWKATVEGSAEKLEISRVTVEP